MTRSTVTSENWIEAGFAVVEGGICTTLRDLARFGLMVHRPTQKVIARFSTWPDRWDERLVRHADAANLALIEALMN